MGRGRIWRGSDDGSRAALHHRNKKKLKSKQQPAQHEKTSPNPAPSPSLGSAAHLNPSLAAGTMVGITTVCAGPAAKEWLSRLGPIEAFMRPATPAVAYAWEDSILPERRTPLSRRGRRKEESMSGRKGGG